MAAKMDNFFRIRLVCARSCVEVSNSRDALIELLRMIDELLWCVWLILWYVLVFHRINMPPAKYFFGVASRSNFATRSRSSFWFATRSTTYTWCIKAWCVKKHSICNRVILNYVSVCIPEGDSDSKNFVDMPLLIDPVCTDGSECPLLCLPLTNKC